MRALSLVFCSAALLAFSFSGHVAAEESMLSKLNPFSSKPTPPPSKQNKTFPGFSNHHTTSVKKRTPEPSMASKLGTSTKTAWNKTTDYLSPKHLFSPGSTTKTTTRTSSQPQSKKPASSWSPFSMFQADEPKKEPQTLGEWLKMPHNNP